MTNQAKDTADALIRCCQMLYHWKTGVELSAVQMTLRAVDLLAAHTAALEADPTGTGWEREAHAVDTAKAGAPTPALTALAQQPASEFERLHEALRSFYATTPEGMH